MNEIETKAQELANTVNAQILEARKELALQMIEKGQTEDMYVICDNIVDIIEKGELTYRCWSAPRPEPRMKRGETDNG